MISISSPELADFTKIFNLVKTACMPDIHPTSTELNLEQWASEKMDIEVVKSKLVSLGLEEDAIAEKITEFKKLRHKARQFKGFVYLAAGAFMGFLSCVLTLTNPVPELYNWILYGFTSLAILIIMLGLYYLLE